MKKLLALVLATIMILACVTTFTSCGKDDTLVCGVTIFEKMNEKDANGNWTGFESEFAMEVGKILGMKVEFQEIVWEQKLVDFSYGYMLNQQCIVVKADNLANYTSEESLSGKKACVEGGSAGESYAKSVTDEDKVVKATAQINAFTEVKSGAVDFIVVDILLAQNLCGKGDYSDLAIVEAIELESEIYAIGFKKGSDLTAKVNDAIKQLEQNGKLLELAQKYGFENVLKVSEKID